MKSTLPLLALGAALFAGHAIAATLASLPFPATSSETEHSVPRGIAATATESEARLVLIDSEDDEDDGEEGGYGQTYADDEDDDGRVCANGSNAQTGQGCVSGNAPIADPNAPPPANGLFGGTAAPKVQIN